MLLKKLDIVSDADKVLLDLEKTNVQWPLRNQISLKYRTGSEQTWFDGIGSLTGRDFGAEKEFVNWCIDSSYYVRQEIERLENILGIKTSRIRFMKMDPKTSLTIHQDSEVRYHLVLKTNIYAHFGFVSTPNAADNCDLPIVGTTYHVPKDNHWYRADTTNLHWVFNGGKEDRIHLVVNEMPK